MKTAGLLPIMKQVLKNSDQALASILAGSLAGASSAHEHNMNLMQAFLQALDGSSGGLTKYPQAVDFNARANAILQDLEKAQASMVTSAASAPPSLSSPRLRSRAISRPKAQPRRRM